MGKAQEQLGDKQPEPALKDQDQAIEALKQTMKELDAMAEEARRELLKLPFDELAKKQQKTQQATDNMLYTVRCMMVLNELDELSVQGLVRAQAHPLAS